MTAILTMKVFPIVVLLCWIAKDFDEDDDEDDDATKEKSKKQESVETEESFDKHSKISKSKEDGDHKGMERHVHYRVTVEDTASSKAKTDSDDSLPVDQQRPAAKQQPEESVPQATQPLANKLKDQLEQAGLKTAGLIYIILITATAENFSSLDIVFFKFKNWI